MKRTLALTILFFSLTAIGQDANLRLSQVEQLQFQSLKLEQELLQSKWENLQLRLNRFKDEVEKAHPDAQFDLNSGTLYKRPQPPKSTVPK